jgi:hypothetical protein
MKRSLLFSLLCVFSLLSVSCVTGTRRSSFRDYPAAPFFGTYRINSVTVTVDHVKEDRIAAQLAAICQTWLESKQRRNPFPPRRNPEKGQTDLLVDITVEQRSFMHDVELYNAIYVSCLLRDEAGNIYGSENEYITGKRTVIAATELDRIMGPVIEKVLKGQDRRYRAALRYQKKHEK